jgi:Ca2+-transporting ATPase
MKASDVLRDLRVRRDFGLKNKEVAGRREQYGANQLPKGKGYSITKLFFKRLRDVLILILVAAAAISIVFGRYGDAVIILIAILIDVGLGFAQVWRTEKTLEKIREHIRFMAAVLREGSVLKIPAHDLVVGDIIELRAGQRVPADARLIEVNGLRTREAALTGESADITKTMAAVHSRTAVSNRKNMVFMGTSIVNGSAKAIVVATGIRTELGKIAQVIKAEKSPLTPLRKKLQHTGIQIGGAIIGAVILLLIIGLVNGQEPVQTVRTAITLIVSAIPEDLTMILTIALTIGVARILRQRGVIRELGSGETLGATTVICTDKTGTLTQGIMVPEYLDFLQGDRIKEDERVVDQMQRLALLGFTLASDAHRTDDNGDENTQDTEDINKIEYIGTATERTALAFAENLGVNQIESRKQWRQRGSISFSPQWKYRATLHDHPTQATNYIFVSGAPEILLEKSSHALNNENEAVSISSKKRFEMGRKLESLASAGKRLVAVAVRRNVTQQHITHDDITDLLFLGVLAINDPIRVGVREAITQTRDAGVKVKIVTGDHIGTAKAVTRQLGLAVSDNHILSSEMLQNMPDAELRDLIDDVVIFSRATPLDKQRIVRSLQANGHVVAMTGDGVNDAVALKVADIGVAMGSGTDIAKEAADLILLDDSFSTIVAAIREGRVLRDNVRKVIVFLLSTNAAEVAIFFVSLLLRLPLPLLPAQILWVNLVTDGTSDIALALEPEERGTMKRGPENPGAPLLGKTMVQHIIFSGVVVTLATMGLYWYLFRYVGTDLVYARTMSFTVLSIISLLSVWSFRSLKESILTRGFWGNLWVPVSLALSAGLHMLAIYAPSLQGFFGTVPLSLRDWALIVIVAVVAVILIDLRKIVIKEKKNNSIKQKAPLMRQSNVGMVSD